MKEHVAVRFLLTATLALVFISQPAAAQTTTESASLSETAVASPDKSSSGVVKFDTTLAFNGLSLTTIATCTRGYAAQCGDSNKSNCTCFIAANGAGKGPFGTTSTAVFEVTNDAEDASANSLGTCTPSWGYLQIPGTLDTEDIEFSGVTCRTSSDAFDFTVLGGFQLASESSTFFSAFGTSTSGMFSEKKGTSNLLFKLKLTGTACKLGASCD